MKKNLVFLPFLLFAYFNAVGQCQLDFGSTSAQFNFSTQSGSDIVNASSSGANESSTQSFDIWDESNDDCSVAGGADDITFDFEIIHAFDQYNVDGIIDAYAGSTHDITQSSSGLRGNIPLGNSSTNESSTADVRGYKITISFAAHTAITAGDVIVNLTSVNTAGEAHESSSLVFLDETGSPYGSALYNGYYMGTTGASTDGSCSSPALRSESWSTSGTGVYTASSTVNTNIGDPCNPVAGSDGSNNNTDVNPVTNAGLSISDPIGGLVFTVYLEDVAASIPPDPQTSTSTQFTSTINGIDISGTPLPIELAHFKAIPENEEVLLSWTTITELNNKEFDIQWSRDGNRFESIGSVAGEGNSVQTIDYEFRHQLPAKENNYYRLKQIDFDGHFSYSNIQNVYIEDQDKVLVFPTIVSNQLTIVKSEAASEIVIFNLNGSVVKTILNNRDQEVQIDIADLPVGNYFIKTVVGSAVFTEKIIVMR